MLMNNNNKNSNNNKKIKNNNSYDANEIMLMNNGITRLMMMFILAQKPICYILNITFYKYFFKFLIQVTQLHLNSPTLCRFLILFGNLSYSVIPRLNIE